MVLGAYSEEHLEPVHQPPSSRPCTNFGSILTATWGLDQAEGILGMHWNRVGEEEGGTGMRPGMNRCHIVMGFVS